MRISEQTLAKYAVRGCGPEFQRYSRDVVYTVQKLDEWAHSRLSKPLNSTSQTNASAARTETANRMSRDYLRQLTKEELIELLLARRCGAGPPYNLTSG
jgi:hypothetical protein